MFDRWKNFLRDDSFHIIFEERSVYISNYKKLISLEDNYISILSPHKKILITGKNLVLNKILDDECLISGDIFKIEVKDER